MSDLTQKPQIKWGKILLVVIACFCVMIGLRVDAIALERPTTLPGISFSTEATEITKTANANLADTLNFANNQDFLDAERGFIATLPPPYIIKDDKGNVVWDLEQYSFVYGDPPDTVNPSLWRNAKLNMRHGLFKVVDRIYQVRGFDLAVMSLIEGDTGWIIVDPLTSLETAKAALELANEKLGEKPVKAVIYTHSHIDHFAGVKGVTSQEAVDSGDVKIYAPDGFLEEAVSENVMAGNVMSRRASYMYGNLISKSAIGQIDGGLGKTTATGTVTLIAPTDVIEPKDARPDGLIEREIDGVKFLFQNVPGSEAPAELMFYLPELNAFCSAEDATHTLHNLYTLRGAKVRDALAWSRYINETIEYVNTIDWTGSNEPVVFASHHWPTWGKEAIVDYLKKQRDLYKYIHDQTLRLANQGYNMVEIAEMIKLPESLAQEWYNRGYYGSVNHDVKAVYQRYLGWFDGNPANLYALPPEEEAKRYVEFMGGADNVIAQAHEYYNNGDYRWVAKVMSHVVFADPNNHEARALEAAALQQLGYQAESGPWRNFFLSGTLELLNGVDPNAPAPKGASPDILQAMTPDMLFDFMALSLNGPKADGKIYTFNIDFTDEETSDYVLTVENSVLNYFEGKQAEDADTTIHLSRKTLNDVILHPKTLPLKLRSGKIFIEGDSAAFKDFLSLLDKFEFWFNIVLP